MKIRVRSPLHNLSGEGRGQNDLYSRILLTRNVQPDFFDQDCLQGLKKVHDGRYLKGMEAATALLLSAMKAGNRILIVGDYDADGATSTAILVSSLCQMGANVAFFIPDRNKHGYGLSPSVITDAILKFGTPEKGDILLTVDNGINAFEGIAFAKKAGYLVIITDHHLPSSQLPDADAVVNPHQEDCPYPAKTLAGCGVAFLIAMKLAQIQGVNIDHVLSLVALGTIADVVPLCENNLRLVSAGLDNIRKGIMSAGLKALFLIKNIDFKNATSEDLAFYIAPTVNAAGRLADMSIGVRCLIAESECEAFALAEQLSQLNQERKKIESEEVGDAVNMILQSKMTNISGIAIFNPEWNAGVIGIVASRIKEKILRPVIIMTNEREKSDLPGEYKKIKGSGRSISGINIRDVLVEVDRRSPGVLLKFGGHAMAAGVTIDGSKIEIFQSVFAEVCAEASKVLIDGEFIEVDELKSVKEITPKIALKLSSIPWGANFPAPVFSSVFRVVNSKRMGGSSHLLLERDELKFKAVQFKASGSSLPRFIRAFFSVKYDHSNNDVLLVISHVDGSDFTEYRQ